MFSHPTAALLSENVNFTLFPKLTEKEINYLKSTFTSCHKMVHGNGQTAQQSRTFTK